MARTVEQIEIDLAAAHARARAYSLDVAHEQANVVKYEAELAEAAKEERTEGRKIADEIVTTNFFRGVKKIVIGWFGCTDSQHPKVDIDERAETIREFLAEKFNQALASQRSALEAETEKKIAEAVKAEKERIVAMLNHHASLCGIGSYQHGIQRAAWVAEHSI